MQKKSQTGFSLMEVLVSALIASFGLLSLASLQITSVKVVNTAHSDNIASLLTMELSERMRSNPKGVSGGFYSGTAVCTNQVKQCRDTIICTAEETAIFDLQEIMCGVSTNNISQGGARNLLPQGSLRVSCVNGCDQPDAIHDVTVSWSTQVLHKKQNDEARVASLTTAIIP